MNFEMLIILGLPAVRLWWIKLVIRVVKSCYVQDDNLELIVVGNSFFYRSVFFKG